MGKFFITGATGTVGQEVVRALRSQGHAVIAATRNPEKAELGEGVQAVRFDFADPATFAAARESDGVFLLGPPLTPGLFEMLSPFVDYLKAEGPQRLVYLSSKGSEHMGDALPFHLQMENKLKEDGFDWRILRPGFFMQNFKNYEWENISQRKVLFSPAGDGKTAFISSRDIGDSAAALLTKDEFGQQLFELTGSEEFGYQDVAAQLTEILGEPIHYANPDNATYKQVLADAGAPAFIGEYMTGVYGAIAQNKVGGVTDGVLQLTGHAPESLREVLERDFAN